MRQRLYVAILAGVIGFGLLNTVARAQHYPIEGKIVSASTTLPPGSTSAIVFTTPDLGHFMLTEFCSTLRVFPAYTLSGSTFGVIADTGPLPEPGCVAFYPAIVLPKREVIICSASGPIDSNTYCRITGIVEAEDSPKRGDCHKATSLFADSCRRSLDADARSGTFPIEGKIVSASTSVTEASTATVFTTPDSGHFILTVFCSNSSSAFGSTFGFIVGFAPSNLSAHAHCHAFNPGVALPRREAILCEGETGASYCNISGILEEED